MKWKIYNGWLIRGGDGNGTQEEGHPNEETGYITMHPASNLPFWDWVELEDGTWDWLGRGKSGKSILIFDLENSSKT